MLSYRSRFTRISSYLCCNVVNLAPRPARRKERGRTRARSEPYAPECVEEEFSEVRQTGASQEKSQGSTHRFQKAGERSARAVKISNLPSSMHTVSTTRPKGSTIS